MDSLTVWTMPKKPKSNLVSNFHKIRIHSVVAFSITLLLSLQVVVLSFFVNAEVKIEQETLVISVSHKTRPASASGLAGKLSELKSVDVMKYTKDVLRNQPTDAEIEGIVTAIANNIHPTHIAISIPMDASEDYPIKSPAPRTAYAFTQKWADAIHSKGLKIIWRGTWSGIEGIYDFKKLDGADRFPAGNAQSAITDGSNSWLGKTYKYIIDNPGFFGDGDIWAVMPERTEGIFQDGTSFLPHSAPGIQANYANFFNGLKTVSDLAFASINKNVTTGWTANNFTEVKSGWLNNSIFTNAQVVAIDHYGLNHTVEEMEADIRTVYSQKKKPVFLQEWGDYWNQSLSLGERAAYLQNMYNTFQKLADEGILIGFNYWGGWSNNLEGILTKTSTGYEINERGQLLASFFANNLSSPAPVIEPSPIALAPVAQPPVPAPALAPQPLPTATEPAASTKPDSSIKPPVSTNPAHSANQPEKTLTESKAALPTPANNSPAASEPIKNAVQTLAYPTGSLVNENGTIYFINRDTKIPFTNFEAFRNLGFASKPIVKGNLANYKSTKTYKIESSNQAHPWGSWLIYKGTVYYSHESGLIGVPSLNILSSNKGSLENLIPANQADLNRANSTATLTLNDNRVY